MLRITGLTKKLFLAALLCCSSLSNLHALIFWPLSRWTSTWFVNTFLGGSPLGQIYPGNVISLIGTNALSTTNQYTTAIDNQMARAQYPKACEWVELQLKRASIDSNYVQLENTPCIASQKALPRKLTVSLSALESLLQKKATGTSLTTQENRLLDQIQTIIFHEIGHIKHQRAITVTIVAPALAIAGSEIMGRSINTHSSLWFSTFLKTLCSRAIINTIDRFDEYRADSYAIHQTKDRPEALINTAAFFLEEQHQQNKATLEIFLENNTYLIPLARNTFYYGIVHWCCDTHGSDIARANRLLRNAGVKTSQTELMQELDRQSEKYAQYQPSWSERLLFWRPRKPFDFDMSPILAASEKNKTRAAESEKRAEKFRELLTLGGYGD